MSVITIFLDSKTFLAEAVESVLAQSAASWELLLVDDGSTDGSSDVGRGYAARDPARIRYLDHPDHANRGMSASRNLGLRHARGRYVAFLDADDVWCPNKLQQQVEILEREPAAAMVQGAPVYWRSWRDPTHVGADHVATLPAPPEALVAPPALLLSALTVAAPPPWPSDVLIRRDVVERVGGFEDAFRGLYEDQAFFAKLQLKSAIFVSGQTWLKYRLHDGSCCATTKRAGRHHAARVAYLRWLKHYLATQEEIDRTVAAVIEEQLRPYRAGARLRRALARAGGRVRSGASRARQAARRLRVGVENWRVGILRER